MYSHLSKQQRIEFGALRRANLSLRAAARLLGVHHRTMTRRLAANQRFRKIVPGGRLEQLLVAKIRKMKWAPEQCAGWLKQFRQCLYVCAQTIYDWIYQSREDLVVYLHCTKGKYRRTRQARLRKDQLPTLQPAA